MIYDIQIETCFFFLIFALLLAFQFVLTATHGHKTEIGSSQDPVKICHLDIGFQLDLCLSVQFSIGCIRKIFHPDIFFFRRSHFRLTYLHFMIYFLISLLNRKKCFSFFRKLCFLFPKTAVLLSERILIYFSDFFFLLLKVFYNRCYSFLFRPDLL